MSDQELTERIGQIVIDTSIDTMEKDRRKARRLVNKIKDENLRDEAQDSMEIFAMLGDRKV